MAGGNPEVPSVHIYGHETLMVKIKAHMVATFKNLHG